MRILVCGGRDYNNKELVYRVLDALTVDPNADPKYPMPIDGTVIISGGARGTDTIALDWAVVNWTLFEEYPAQWDKYGKGAGPIRNKQMLDEGKPDIVVAFPGGRGTQNMIEQATRAGVPVFKVVDGLTE